MLIDKRKGVYGCDQCNERRERRHESHGWRVLEWDRERQEIHIRRWSARRANQQGAFHLCGKDCIKHKLDWLWSEERTAWLTG